MMRQVFYTLLLAFSFFAAVAEGRRVFRAPEHVEKSGNCIVKLRSSTSHEDFERTLSNALSLSDNAKVYARSEGLFKYFTIDLTETALAEVKDFEDVEYIEEETMATGTTLTNSWALDRIDQISSIHNNVYNPGTGRNGEGIDIYVLDSGINYNHSEFGGRAQYPGFDPVDEYSGSSQKGEDCHGHGTHVASLAVGELYGVAKQATVYSVRVLHCDNTSPWSVIMRGLDLVAETVKKDNRRAIISMSLGGQYSNSVNELVQEITNMGIPVVVSAGNNNNSDACLYSPASAPSAVTVAGTREGDALYSLTNVGSCVDIFAPAEGVLGADFNTLHGAISTSGTSMATPIVSGVLAIYLQEDLELTVTQLTDLMIQNSLKGAVDFTPLEALNFSSSTPNRFIQVKQVQAQFNCYPTTNCEAGEGIFFTEVATVSECCSQDVTAARSYVPIDGSAACQPCIVISIGNKTVDESAGAVTLDVSLTRGTLDQRVDISYETVDLASTDNATSGSDYEASQGTLTFDGTTSVQTITINIIEDSNVEVDEYFQVAISTNDASVTLNPSSAIVTIQDTDQLTITVTIPNIIFEKFDPYAVEFSAVQNLESPVTLRAFTVPNVMDGYAKEHQDYVPFNTTVIMMPGQSPEASIPAMIVNDKIYERTQERFAVRMEVPEQPLKGRINLDRDEAEVIIQNDDVPRLGFKQQSYIVGERESNLVVEVEIKVIDGTELPIAFTMTDTEGTAKRGTDYVGPISANLEIHPGETSVQHNISILSDDTVEVNETFTLQLESEFPLLTDFDQAVVTITEEVYVTVGFESTTYSVSESSSTVQVCVIIEDPENLADDKVVNVMLNSIDEIATATSDYTSVDQMSVTLTPLTPSSCVDVAITQDEVLETNETFKLSLTSDADTVTVSPSETQITIQNDDAVTVGFKMDRYTYDESDEQAVVDVVFMGQTAVDVEVSVMGGPSAQMTVGGNKLVFDGTLTFSGSGPQEMNVSATIMDDSIALEDNEEVTVQLTAINPTSGVNFVTNPSTVVVIVDDDSLEGSFRSRKYTVNEGAGTVQICVEKSLQAIQDAVFHLSFREGSAKDQTDFNLMSSMITIPSTTSSACFSVDIINDSDFESTENFFVKLLDSSTPSASTEFDETEIEITDDDGVRVSFKANQYSYQESDGQAFVEVVLLGQTSLPVVVSVTGGPSNQENIGTDRVTFSENVTFTAGGGTTEHIVATNILNDMIALEADEIVNVDLAIISPTTGVVFGDFSTTTVTIEDDDSLTASFKTSNVTVNEGVGMVQICVEKDLQTIRNVVLTYQPRNGTATDESDYSLTGSTITIAKDSSDSCFSVEIKDDVKLENTESFFVDLSNSDSSTDSLITLGHSSTEIEIVDNDDVTVSFKAAQYTYQESDGNADVVVVLDGEIAVDVVASVMGGPSTANNIGTYRVHFDSMVTFTAGGPTEQTVSAQIHNDMIALEGDEQIDVILSVSSSATGANPGSISTTVVTIKDDDMLNAILTKSVISVNESGSADICVAKDLQTISDVEFNLQFSEGNATETEDYLATPSTITVPKNGLSQCISVQTVDDTLLELTENFFVDLSYSDASTVSLVELGMARTEVKIMDNDAVQVGFKQDMYTYSEGDGQATVGVVLQGQTAVDVVLSVTGGSSGAGTNGVEFNTTVTFSGGSSTEQSAMGTIQNNEIALEDDVLVTVSLNVISPASGVTITGNTTTAVTIVDDDSLTVKFNSSEVTVEEGEGMVEICVAKSHYTTSDVVLDLQYQDGTDIDGSDYSAVRTQITIPASNLDQCFNVEILDDEDVEDMENFFVQLSYTGGEAVSMIAPSSIMVSITDDDEPPTQEVPIVHECTLSSDLVLQPFSSQYSFNISKGCEHTLVKTCKGSGTALEIRVDFHQNDFSTTKVAINYERERVIMHEDLSVESKTTPLSKIVNESKTDMVSVSVPEIMLDVTRNLTHLTVTFGSTPLQLAGLCGNISGDLFFPRCDKTLDSEEDKRSFVHSYKIKPSDLILSKGRDECGKTAKDTVIHEPLMTVPIHVPGDDPLYLCYEIQGTADQYFNFVSDECTSVNAHYVQATVATDFNIIDSISIVAVDKRGGCHHISVEKNNSNGCMVTVDGSVLTPESEMSKKRSHPPLATYEMNGISVRKYTSRIRVSVPNCADNSLVMYVTCENMPLYDGNTEMFTEPTDLIRFEIVRGLNLKEYSHGLLGQFWNIPVTVTPYKATTYYKVTVNHPSSKSRSFGGELYFLDWDNEHKKCVYVGNSQGGFSPEVPELKDSVIQGTSTDYITSGPFATQFHYDVFNHACSA